MTLYKTQLVFYHRDPLTAVDQNVLKTQVVQYTCLQGLTVFWTECLQEKIEFTLEELEC